jgi:hypothetical protein
MYLGHGAKVLLGTFVGVPVLLVWTKSLRIQSRDEYEVLADVRYKAIFWKRGSDFSRELSNTLMRSVLEDPERAEA